MLRPWPGPWPPLCLPLLTPSGCVAGISFWRHQNCFSGHRVAGEGLRKQSGGKRELEKVEQVAPPVSPRPTGSWDKCCHTVADPATWRYRTGSSRTDRAGGCSGVWRSPKSQLYPHPQSSAFPFAQSPPKVTVPCRALHFSSHLWLPSPLPSPLAGP